MLTDDAMRLCARTTNVFGVLSRLVLMADEVYQENIYQSKTPFVSCKKVRLFTLVTQPQPQPLDGCPPPI